MSFSVSVGTLQLTEHKDQTLLDQDRNRGNPCKIKQFYSKLHWDNAANLTINSKNMISSQPL